jgi:16S rRNA (cytosine967-C5)-methyltransferase
VIQAVLTALTDQENGASLDLALSKALKTTRGLDDPKDRRRAVQELHAINRHRARLAWHLGQDNTRLSPHHLFLAWNAFESRGDPIGIRITELDRALLQRMAARMFADPKMPEAARLECPPTFEAPLRLALGADFVAEMEASLAPAPIDLRVNLLKSTVVNARKQLKLEKIDTRSTPSSPWGLRAQPGTNASATAAFRDGLIEFQDEGSQLAALLCDARAGQQVMDFCAGTGGKSLALGAAMENRGHLVVCDISEVRLARAKLRLKRAGVENAERKLLPAVDDKAMKKFHARFDRVLVDAPCSGTGSWRRNPDVRWSGQAGNLAELTALQDKILVRAASFVKPGGRLIYATCSLLLAENDERVNEFLRTHRDFERLDAREVWSTVAKAPWPCGESPVLRLSPAKHGTDGFFAAVLQRIPAAR